MKVNKPSKCRNPLRYCLPSYLSRQMTSSQRSYFNALAFFVYTQLWSRFWNQILSSALTLQNGEKSLDKNQTKPGPKKKTNGWHLDRRQNLAESDKGLWFNQPLEIKVDSASSLDVPGLLQKIKAVKKAEEHNNVTGEPLPGTRRSFFILGF